MIYECTDCGWVGDELRANKLCPNCGYGKHYWPRVSLLPIA